MIDETGLSTCINLIKCRFLDTSLLHVMWFPDTTVILLFITNYLVEVPGVGCGTVKIELKQKTYNLFSLCHPQGYP